MAGVFIAERNRESVTHTHWEGDLETEKVVFREGWRPTNTLTSEFWSIGP